MSLYPSLTDSLEQLMTSTDVAISMFERIGGRATIDALVDRFYDRMDTLPEA